MIDPDEVRFYRDVKGLTWRVIADFIGVKLWQLERFIRRQGLEFQVRKVSAMYEDGYERTKANRLARRYGYRTLNDAVRDWRMQGQTRAEIAARLGVHENTVYRHTPDHLKNQLHARTERSYRAACRNLERARAILQEQKTKNPRQK